MPTLRTTGSTRGPTATARPNSARGAPGLDRSMSFKGVSRENSADSVSASSLASSRRRSVGASLTYLAVPALPGNHLEETAAGDCTPKCFGCFSGAAAAPGVCSSRRLVAQESVGTDMARRSVLQEQASWHGNTATERCRHHRGKGSRDVHCSEAPSEVERGVQPTRAAPGGSSGSRVGRSCVLRDARGRLRQVGTVRLRGARAGRWTLCRCRTDSRCLSRSRSRR